MKKIFNQRGMTIPLVLLILAITFILGSASLRMINSQARFNRFDHVSKTAYEYAEAGYNKYLWYLNDNPDFYSHQKSIDMQNVDIPYQDGYYRLTVTRPSSDDRFITIKSVGWTENNPDIKRIIEAKIRKKQFVHHVYVSNDEGSNIWWTTGDEVVGPYHTNGDLRIQQRPIFWDTVSYNKKKKLDKGTGYNPDFKIKNPVQPQPVEILEFPPTNASLKTWAEKDNMAFYGRTCIYLDNEYIKIRNGNAKESEIKTYRISDIKNKVIYVDKVAGGGTDKFDLKSGNIFISGTLKGVLTIAASNDIYITYDDPTNWYEYEGQSTNVEATPPSQPPISFKWKDNSMKSYPEKGGILYKSTTFNASDKSNITANGKDMLGLIANNDIKILHYGWPKRALDADLRDSYWNFEWIWKDNGIYETKYLSRNNTYNDVWIAGTYYSRYTITRSGNYRVGKPDFRWSKGISTETKYDVGPNDITIHSALFSVNGGFGYEDYNKGSRKGDINMWGNITQKIRLAVGTIGTSGYNKKYVHDPRMFYDYPPHILEPTNVGWEIHEWKEGK